jgi:hypothetical protein
MFILYLLHAGTVHEFPLFATDIYAALLETHDAYIIADNGWEFWKLERT